MYSQHHKASIIITPISTMSISEVTREALMAPYRHVSRQESKGIRTMLVDAIDVWTQVPQAVRESVQGIIGILHNASLMIDDIEDGSELRRGAPAAHVVFGMPRTLNCANQMYFEALRMVLALPALAACNADAEHRLHYTANLAEFTAQLSCVFAEEMVDLHEGQGMDIVWRDTRRCPSLDEYDVMVTKKTGGLFRLALRLMMVLASPISRVANTKGGGDVLGASSHASDVSSMFLSDEDVSTTCSSPTTSSPAIVTAPVCGSPQTLPQQLVGLVEVLGVYFQVLDDLLNICCDEYHTSKTFFEDITEGKFSFPIVHCIHQSLAQGVPLLDTPIYHHVCSRPTEHRAKVACVQLLHQAGSLEATRDRVERLAADISNRLACLGGSRNIIDILAKMNRLLPQKNCNVR